ncbi:hypothetical protein BSL78_00436 [Apostichopus japonicus]|uniref:Uncharacterized protein n=1 Tax=Stichopus japonicus TaxID=307972 RepID=A0A2G8LQY7_STIJA|nr:hypothetical protein BSL78_00436 [Apostichopus japonicus]
MTTILGPLYREIHWSSTKFLAIPETAVTFFPAMLQNRRRTSSHNRVKHKSNFSPTKYYQSQSKISFIATNSWRNELPQRRQKFFTFSEIKTGKLYFHSKVLFKLLNGSVESILLSISQSLRNYWQLSTDEYSRMVNNCVVLYSFSSETEQLSDLGGFIYDAPCQESSRSFSIHLSNNATRFLYFAEVLCISRERSRESTKMPCTASTRFHLNRS